MKRGETSDTQGDVTECDPILNKKNEHHELYKAGTYWRGICFKVAVILFYCVSLLCGSNLDKLELFLSALGMPWLNCMDNVINRS